MPEVWLQDTFTVSQRTMTDEGFLVINGNKLARPGILEYRAIELGLEDRSPMERVRVYRSPEVLFHPDVISSAKSKPVSIRHSGGLLDSKSVKKFSVGHLKDDISRSEEDFLTGGIVVMAEEGVRAINDGARELSLGYKSNLEFTPGVAPDGERYDARMTSMKVNHVALTTKARCGSDCVISDSNTEGDTMPMETQKFHFDGVDYDLTPTGVQIISKLQGQRDAAIDSLSAAEAKVTATMDSSAQEVGKLQAEIDVLKGSQMTAEQLDQAVAERSEFLTTVKTLDSAFETKGKDDATIRRDVVAKMCNLDSEDAKLQNDAYVQARFDMLVEHSTKTSTATARTVPQKAQGSYSILSGVHTDSKPANNMTQSQQARAALMQRNATGQAPAPARTAAPAAAFPVPEPLGGK